MRLIVSLLSVFTAVAATDPVDHRRILQVARRMFESWRGFSYQIITECSQIRAISGERPEYCGEPFYSLCEALQTKSNALPGRPGETIAENLDRVRSTFAGMHSDIQQFIVLMRENPDFIENASGLLHDPWAELIADLNIAITDYAAHSDALLATIPNDMEMTLNFATWMVAICMVTVGLLMVFVAMSR